jgi:hypothetical protein
MTLGNMRVGRAALSDLPPQTDEAQPSFRDDVGRPLSEVRRMSLIFRTPVADLGGVFSFQQRFIVFKKLFDVLNLAKKFLPLLCV